MEETEKEIQARGLTAPRVTPEQIDAVCCNPPQYHVFPGTTVTVCCLTLVNGFTVVGQSACASPANFDRELGEKIALADAKRNVWALEAYLLRENMLTLGGRADEQDFLGR